MLLELTEDRLIVSKKNEIIFLILDDIIYIERYNQTSIIHTLRRQVSLRVPLKQLLELLSKDFIRSHRSYIINKNCVSQLIALNENCYESIYDCHKRALIKKEYVHLLK